MKAVVPIEVTPCTESPGGGCWGHKRQRRCEGRKACWKFPASDLYSMGHEHIEWLAWVPHDSTKETAFRPQPTYIRQTTRDGCADRGSWMGTRLNYPFDRLVGVH